MSQRWLLIGVFVALFSLAISGGQEALAQSIEVWDWHLPRIEIYQKYAEIYEQETGISVVINHMPGAPEYGERMSLALASGVLPDLVQFHPQYIAAFHNHMAPWPVDMFDIYNWADEMVGLEWWLDEEGLLRYTRKVVSARLMFYNSDMWDQAGLPGNATDYSRTWTWDDFTSDARRLTRHASDGSLAVAGVNFTPRLLFNDFYMQLGGRLYSEDGSTTALNSHLSQAQRVADMINDLYHVSNVAQAGSSFTGMTAAIQHDGPWADGTFAEIEGLNYGVLFNPTPNGQWAPYGYNAGDFSLAIFDALDDERKERAFAFLSWMLNNDDFWVEFALAHSAPPTLSRVWGDPRLMESAPMRVVMEVAPYTVPIADDPAEPRSAIDRLGEILAAGEMDANAALEQAIQEYNVGMMSVPPVKAVEYTYEQPELPPFQK